MKDTTARHFAQLFLQEMADEYGATATEIKTQMPMAQAIVAGLLFEDAEKCLKRKPLLAFQGASKKARIHQRFPELTRVKSPYNQPV